MELSTWVPYIEEMQTQFIESSGRTKQDEGLWFVLDSLTEK